MKNTLVISDSGNETYNFKYDDVTYLSLDVQNSVFRRLIYRILYITGFVGLFYAYKFRNIDFKKFDVILLNETRFPVHLLKYLSRHKHHATLIYWLWNTVGKAHMPKFFDVKAEFNDLLRNKNAYNYHIASFDKDDCRKYGFINYPQCVPYLRAYESSEKSNWDIFFIGRDKSRLSMLMKLKEKFTNQELKCKFIIFPQDGKEYSPLESNNIYKGVMLSYEEVIRHDLQSKAILDIVQEGQGGLTWRPIESIFYKKKLITNYQDIINYDLYTKDNVFILGKDDLDDLKKFVNSPWSPVLDETRRKYTFAGCLDHVLQRIKNKQH